MLIFRSADESVASGVAPIRASAALSETMHLCVGNVLLAGVDDRVALRIPFALQTEPRAHLAMLFFLTLSKPFSPCPRRQHKMTYNSKTTDYF